MSEMIIVHLVEASVPYEGSWIVAAHLSKANAQAYIDKANRANAAWDRKCAKDEDHFMNHRMSKHFREDLQIVTLKVKP